MLNFCRGEIGSAPQRMPSTLTLHLADKCVPIYVQPHGLVHNGEVSRKAARALRRILFGLGEKNTNIMLCYQDCFDTKQLAQSITQSFLETTLFALARLFHGLATSPHMVITFGRHSATSTNARVRSSGSPYKQLDQEQ